jgi:hypothetical protein
MSGTHDAGHPSDGHPLAVLHDCECLRRSLIDQQAATAAVLEQNVLPLLRTTIEAVATVATVRFGPEYREVFVNEAERLREIAARIQVVLDTYQAVFPHEPAAGR